MPKFSVEILDEATLRNMALDDVRFQSILKLEQDFFSWPWSEQNWLKFLNSSRNFSLSIITQSDDGSVIGFCLFEHFLLDHGSHLYKIILDPGLHGTGAASELTSRHFNFLSTLGVNNCFLEVATDNLRAIGFYEKLGMTKGVIKKKFYANGQDAVVMTGSI